MPYPEEVIRPMREELTRLGVQELRILGIRDLIGANVVVVVNRAKAPSRLEVLTRVAYVAHERPVDLDGRRIDTLTEGMMVEPGQWVRCIDVKAGRVIVRPVDKIDTGGLENAIYR